jgi:hypothetical protein
MKSWAQTLPFGLPDDFDYDVIRSRSDVATLLFTLPNAERGEAARALFERRERIGRALAYAALIEAWEHDDRFTVEAFGTADAFAAALRAVAPPLRRKRPLPVWRGVAVRDAHPAHAAIGLSWTRSRDIACWFATFYLARGDLPGARPFVFSVALLPEEIVALYDVRGEQEVIVDPAMLELNEGPIKVDGTTMMLAELAPDSTAPAGALADWQAAGQRYEAQKQQRQRQELWGLRRKASTR